MLILRTLRFFLLCLILALTSLRAHAAAPAGGESTQAQAPRQTQDGQDRSLAALWEVRVGDVSALVQEAAALQKQADEKTRPLAEEMQAARSEFTRLSSLYQVSRSHPAEQLTLVQQMRTVQQRMKKRLTPLEEIAQSINSRLEEIDALSKELGDIEEDARQGAASADQALTGYKRSMQEARRSLASTAARLKNMLAPAKASMSRIDQSVSAIETELVPTWEHYYLTASDTNLETLASTPALLAEWVGTLRSRIAFAYPQSPDEWFNALKSFLAYAIGTTVLGSLAARGARRLPGHWGRSLERAISGSCFWIALGLSILAASSHRSGGIYSGFVLGGSLVLIAGVAALSWRLRTTAVPSLEGKPSPLSRLYLPAAAGVLMLFSDLPPRILGLMWALVMLFFLATILYQNSKREKRGDLPLLERISYSCSFWFALGSLLISLGGFARMAILFFMLLFALVNTVTLGSALAELAKVLASRLCNETDMPVRNALAEALGIPAAWLLSLFCTLPWFWAVPGARYIAAHALSASYTVGEASFDFSRLLFLVPLFFLFRSLIRLSRTSLEHLPERLPSLERGVIPPLRSLASYALWALFGIIALGMIGVNFTSLAVVAGGLSVGIGFGMQNIFNNLISGLMLIFGRTILVGDYVDVAGASGTVRAISIRSTIIETAERALVYVPNSAIMSGQFTNWTRNSRMVRRTLSIGVAYGSSTDLVVKLLLEAAAGQEGILQKPAPAVYLTAFGDNALNFSMNVFIDNLDHDLSAMSGLRLSVERLFREQGIDIPFPQITVHLPEAAREEAVSL